MRTKNLPGGGWAGTIGLVLHGESGNAPEVALSSYWVDSFEPGSTHTIGFYAPSVGPITHVSLRLEPPSGGSETTKWALDYVDIYCSADASTPSFRPAAEFVAPGPPTSPLLRIARHARRVQYEVTAHTSSGVRGAGTDGCLLLRLEGDKGITPELQLQEGPEVGHTLSLSALSHIV